MQSCLTYISRDMLIILYTYTVVGSIGTLGNVCEDKLKIKIQSMVSSFPSSRLRNLLINN